MDLVSSLNGFLEFFDGGIWIFISIGFVLICFILFMFWLGGKALDKFR